MKKILFTVSAAALLSLSCSALELDTDHAYAGGGIAFESINPFSTGMAIVLTGGAPLSKKGKIGPGSIVTEGEFTYTLSKGEVGSLHASLMTIGAYGGYIYNLTPEIYLKPRLGLIYKSVTMDYAGWGGTASATDSKIGIAFGLLAGYTLTKELDLYAGYKLVEGSDITHFTIGANYRF